MELSGDFYMASTLDDCLSNYVPISNLRQGVPQESTSVVSQSTSIPQHGIDFDCFSLSTAPPSPQQDQSVSYHILAVRASVSSSVSNASHLQSSRHQEILCNPSTHRYSIDTLLGLRNKAVLPRRARRAIFALKLWQPYHNNNNQPSIMTSVSRCVRANTHHTSHHLRTCVDQYNFCVTLSPNMLCNYCHRVFMTFLALCKSAALSLNVIIVALYMVAVTIPPFQQLSNAGTSSHNNGLICVESMQRLNGRHFTRNQLGSLYGYANEECHSDMHAASSEFFNYDEKTDNCQQNTISKVKYPSHSYFKDRRLQQSKGQKSDPVLTPALSALATAALINSRSVMNKTELIEDLLFSNKLNYLIIVETWLTGNDILDNTILAEICGQNFSSLSWPRINKKGGGLALIYRNGLKVDMNSGLSQFKAESYEFASVTLSFSSKSIVLIIIYKPPSTSLSLFSSEFTELCSLLLGYNEIIIAGDFNLSVEEGSMLNEILDQFHLCNHVTECTHDKGRILDLIITWNNSSVVDYTEVTQGISDHSTVLFGINHGSHKLPMTCELRKVHIYRDLNLKDFKFDIMNATQDTLNKISSSSANAASRSCDVSMSVLEELLKSVVVKHIPVRTIKIMQFRSHGNMPWWTVEITYVKRLLRKSERLWRNEKLEVHHQMYKKLRNKLKLLITDAKRRHLSDNLFELTREPKKLWQSMNVNLGRQKTQVLPDLSTFSTISLPSAFGSFFNDKIVGIRKQLSSQLMNEQVDNSDEPTNRECVLESWSSATVTEIDRIIKTFSSKTSPQDIVPNRVWKMCIPELAPLVTAVVNASFCSGMPSSHKCAVVTPLIKKKGLDANVMSNYRPVSNLSTISKIIEKAVSNRLTQYLSDNNLFDEHQCAYQKNNSCEMALLSIQDYILRSADGGRVTALILLDMSSAFDTVDHAILRKRVTELGISGSALLWITDYLDGRSQFVRIKNVDSPSLPLMCGVPQGSVLGPLLFSIYVRPLGDIIKKHDVQYKFYADDLQLYHSFHPNAANDAINKLEGCTREIQRWLLHNWLSLNAAKSELILCGTRQQLSKLPNFSIQIAGSVLTRKESARDLGVILDENMGFDRHVKIVSRNALFHLKSIARLRRSLSQSHAQLLVNALVLSRLDFCCSLFVGVKVDLFKILQRVIKAANKFIQSCTKSSQIMVTKKQLTASNRVHLRALSIVWQALDGKAPKFISDLFQMEVISRHLRSNSSHLLQVHFMKSEVGKRAFGTFAARLWNKLPANVKEAPSYHVFRQLCIDNVTM